MRLITRPQQLLRAFFGLGPDQFNLEETIIPTLDIEFLSRSNQDVQTITAQSAAIAPGALGSVAADLPSQGTWLLHAVTVFSDGPATSGTFRMGAVIQLNAAFWRPQLQMAVFDMFDSLPRIGGNNVRLGKWFDKPIVMYRNAAGIADQVFAELFNDAASVGNTTVSCSVLVRPLQSLNP